LREQVSESDSAESRQALSAILGGRPVVAFAFEDMEMVVNEPQKLELRRDSSLRSAQQPLLA
jgi:hypothetical protein